MIYQGCIKGGGKFIKSVEEEYQVVERDREYQGYGEEYIRVIPFIFSHF